MDKIVKNQIFMTESRRFKRVIFSFAGAFAFIAFYLALMTGVTDRLECLLAVLVGAAATGAFLAVAEFKRYVKYIVVGVVGLYCVLCVAIGFQGFLGGACSFVNHAAQTANASMHYGFKSIPDVGDSAVGNFLFCSVLSALLGLGSAAFMNRHVIPFLFTCVLVTLLWFCLGLFPAFYAIVMLVFSIILLLAAHREFAWKSVLCYLAVSAVLFAALSPSVFFRGGNGISAFKSSIGSAIRTAVYGSDTLPEGNLKKASGMRSDKSERLQVTLSGGIRNLYLRGFVGSELDGSVWLPTDKNVYVSDGYQGLLDYVRGEEIPFAQYARYADLCGNESRYSVTVKNTGANRKYVYLPYTAVEYGAGIANYDMNLHAGLFGAKEYSIEVFSGDRSSEVVQQARWLGNENLQTLEMEEYVSVEGQYRRFANGTYSRVDDQTASLVFNAMNVATVHENINPAANVIRNYFRTNFEYSDVADPVGDDFIGEFFGGQIKKANAAYFASAATVAFRAYGYAARYAEGYLVYAEEDETDVAVTGNYSHAWTEVYFDGMGWLPIEVTPGFFTTLTEVDPDDPDEPPVEPIKPPEEEPDEPIEKPEPPKPPEVLTPSEQKMLLSLKVLLPISAVALAVSGAVLVIVVRRTLILDKKRKTMRTGGEAFGRAAYGIMLRDFGKDFERDAEKYGVDAAATERFTQLIQKSVYGGHELSEGERKVVTAYMRRVAEAYFKSVRPWRRFTGKYIRCIGI